MRRRRFLTGTGAGIGWFAGCATGPRDPTPSPTPTGPLSNPSFEAGLNGWVVGEDLPEDPNRPGSRVDNNTGVSDAHASDGEYAIEFFIDGVADDGTLWVEQAVDLSGLSTLAVDVYSPEESFNTLSKVAAYVGRARGGLTEADFDTARAVEDHAGWKTYEYPVRPVEDGLVAVGVSVVWETGVTRWIDNVRLR